jgi:hypothetical protein
MTALDHFAKAELNILGRRGPSTYDFCIGVVERPARGAKTMETPSSQDSPDEMDDLVPPYDAFEEHLQLVKNRDEQPEDAAKENSEGHDHGLHFFVRQPTGGSTSSRQ